jgi:hypothetical protein
MAKSALLPGEPERNDQDCPILPDERIAPKRGFPS